MNMVGIDTDFDDVKLRHVPNFTKHLLHALFNPYQAVAPVLR